MTIHTRLSFDAATLSPFRTVAEISAVEVASPRHAALSKMACFVSRRLANRDPGLGRAGPVCPFARRGAASGGIRFADCTAGSGQEARIAKIMAQVRNDFLQWGENSGIPPMLRAFVVTFSALGGERDAAMIERVQKRLKPDYVDAGLMIGQFYPGCEEGGIRNPEFRPLDAPVISLAIRFMALADAPFLAGDERFRRAFIARHGDTAKIELARADEARAQKTSTLKAGTQRAGTVAS